MRVTLAGVTLEVVGGPTQESDYTVESETIFFTGIRWGTKENFASIKILIGFL